MYRIVTAIKGAKNRRRGHRAFSLLEVMVAVAILGISLTVILSAQGGLAAGNRTSKLTAIATSLARCKMTELEEKLQRKGYSELTETETSRPCCVGSTEANEGFLCDWEIEKISLPNPSPPGGGDAGASELSAINSTSGLLAQQGGTSPSRNEGLGALNLNLNLDAGLAGVSSALNQQLGTGGGAQGLLQFVMGMMYPAMKPLFEASIRKITLTVRWKEGSNERSFELEQYVTNPQRGGFTSGFVNPLGVTQGSNSNTSVGNGQGQQVGSSASSTGGK